MGDSSKVPNYKKIGWPFIIEWLHSLAKNQLFGKEFALYFVGFLIC